MPKPKPKVCQVCFTSSWEPTPDGERCGYCWLTEQLVGARENADAIAVRLGVDPENMTSAEVWHASVGAISTPGYREFEDNVMLTMSKDDYLQLLMMMGFATGKSTPERVNRWLKLVNRINEGNPHFTPYAAT